MGSGSSPQPQYLQPPNQPQIAKSPPEQYYYQNGQLQSSVTRNTRGTQYSINQYQTPAEQNIQKSATGFISNLVPQLNKQFGNMPQAQDQFRQNFASPQIAALNTSYDQALGRATNDANGAGTLNSVGFHNFDNNQIEKNRAQGLSDIQANASNASYDLPGKMIAPYADLFNIYNGALNGQQSQSFNTLQPVQQQSQQGAQLYNAAANRYAPQLYTPPYQPGFMGLF